MEFTQEQYDMLMRHEQSIIRMSLTENSLLDIKMTLQGIAMSNSNFTEKLAEMKASIVQISKDNLDQHKELTGRINEIESKPGKKWDSLWLIVMTAIVSAAAGFFASTFLNVVK